MPNTFVLHHQTQKEQFYPTGVDGWTEFYSNDYTPWQEKNVHPMLYKYASKLGLSTPKRVFMPLCGKSYDMKWLMDNGHTVVGVEGVEIAARDFFMENEIPYSIEKVDFGKVFKANNERLKIFVCDIVCIDPEALGRFDVIWDRGSFFVLPYEVEFRYVEIMKKLFGHDFRYLLMTIQYDDPTGSQEPPRNVPHDRVLKLFGDKCNQKLLQSNDISGLFIELTKKSTFCAESYLLLSPK